MNKHQRLVVIIAAVNIALMLLFPPFLDNPIRRGVLPNFEGFYPLFSAYGVKRIHNELLTLQVMFVVINGLIAWLVLDRQAGKGELPEFRYTRAIGIFAVKDGLPIGLMIGSSTPRLGDTQSRWDCTVSYRRTSA